MMKRGEPDLNRQSVVSGLLLCVALLVAPCAGKEVRAPLSLSAEQVARAGDEFCVWLNLARLTRGLAPEEKPSGASIVIFDRKGRSIACRVIEDLNPLRPHGSGCYVVWRKPKGAPGPFRGSLIIGGKAEPERDATLRGVNRLRNGGFEEPPGKGRILPQHWGSFRFKPGTLIASQEAPRSGRRSLKLANASAKGKGVYFSQGLGVPPTLSDRSAMMYLRFYQKVVKGAVGSGAFCRVRRWDKKGFAGDLGRAMFGSKDAKGWTEVRAVGRVAPGVLRVDLHMGAHHDAPVQVTYFDDFEMQAAPLGLADVSVKPRMVFASEGKVHVRARVFPGRGLFVSPSGAFGWRLRQDFRAEDFGGARLRISLYDASRRAKKPAVTVEHAVNVGKEQVLSLPVRKLKPGKYDLLVDVTGPKAGAVVAAATTLEVEPDPFEGAR